VLIEDRVDLPEEIPEENPLVDLGDAPQLVGGPGVVVPGPPRVPPFEMEQPGAELDEALVEEAIRMGLVPPQILPELVPFVVVTVIEELDALPEQLIPGHAPASLDPPAGPVAAPNLSTAG
jgi:hypothetical protein